MGDESGESTQEVDVTGVGRAQSEIDQKFTELTGGWFQRQGGAQRKERSVIRGEDDVGGQARLARDEERVLQGG